MYTKLDAKIEALGFVKLENQKMNSECLTGVKNTRSE